MSNAPFPITPELTAVALAYRNNRLIADEVLPRTPVGMQEFKYLKYALEDGFTIPDTKVGRKGTPNQVEFGATETTSATQDYGLDDVIPQNDINNAPVNHDPVSRSTEMLTDLILLDREKRVADLVFDANQYATANKVTLSGTSQFSDAGSDPIKTIMDALDACVMRPNIMVMGRAVFSVLSRHAKIVEAALGTGADAGIVRRQAIADLFELEDVLVGESWLNTAKRGQSASLARVWGKHVGLIYRDRLAGPQGGTTFGFTAEWGNRVSGQRPEDVGLRGGVRVRVGESVKELLTANDLGYFIQNAIA